jgi:DNA-binding response OmpR family regulator
LSVSRLLIWAKESEEIWKIANALIRLGFGCSITSNEKELVESDADFLLVDAGNVFSTNWLNKITRQIKQDRSIHIILLANTEVLPDIENISNIEDFIMKPYDLDELSIRIKRLMHKNLVQPESSEILKAGAIVIDLPRCEVKVAGKVVDLTFTEYELLKLLMTKKGHVLTRQMLLNKVWGYDYYGGDRTVDVHITRLRNKIEDPSHNLIETVRNIGYRIIDNDR